MTGFLSSIGDKLAERWVSTLLLPGTLFAAAVLCTVRLGQAHAVDVHLLRADITAMSNQPGAIVVGLGAFLLGSAAAGLAAQAAGRLVVAVWFGRWRGPAALLARPLVAMRVGRARRAASSAGVTPVTVYLPTRPTWIGEQLRLTDVRIAAQYQGLRLALVWPRLWLLVSDGVRAPIQAANNRFRASAVLAGWGLGYVVLGCWWFPAAVVGIGALLAGWVRGRGNAATLATLIEAAVDTQLSTVVGALNLSLPATGITGELADRINDLLHKGR